jgi:hypothetical protein
MEECKRTIYEGYEFWFGKIIYGSTLKNIGKHWKTLENTGKDNISFAKLIKTGLFLY